MRALVQHGYGSPDVLAVREVETPAPGDDDVLVKVHAASVNALDWHVTRGMPYLVRIGEGRHTPKDAIRGIDVAGRVAAVGRNVTQFAAGDEVFGGANGSIAEYATAPAKQLALKPPRLTYEEASTLYVAPLTALQGLRDKARVQPGQRVLVNGAGGGVGTFAVQLAKWLGAQVTAVTRTESIAAMRTLGADEVIDHTSEDFTTTRRAEPYDVIYDIGGNHPFAACRRVMTRKGILVAVGAPAGRWIAPATRLLAAMALSPFVSQQLVPIIAKANAADLKLLAELTESRAISAVIDRVFPLAEAAEAIRYLGAGRARGKVVVRVGE